MAISFPRGSEWRVWDLHIHTPASFHWTGQKFTGDPEIDRQIVDQMINALNMAEPTVFAIMDYWTFDGWLKLKKRLAEPGAPTLNKIVFPGIELRIAAPSNHRLNAHVLFSNTISNQHLADFKSQLRLELIDRPLSDDALIAYARNANADKLKRHGSSKLKVASDDAYALDIGSKIAELTRESYMRAIETVPDNNALGFMPFSTNDGLTAVKWHDHYAFALSLFTSSPIFETRDPALWAAFVGVKQYKNEVWFDSFQEALKHVPRLAVCGSDAHQFAPSSTASGARGYGQFPSDKKTWIKANPTWAGLKHALKEPANRSYIGLLPPQMEKFSANKSFYIDQLTIKKVGAPKPLAPWLDKCALPFNPELVAIIGNKGSGKSALADILALLGRSQQHAHFSFLRKERFRGKTGEPARYFEGRLDWHEGEPQSCLLSDNPALSDVERIQYIPQNRFEHLCNEHASGQSKAFEEELRSVIFAHVPASKRLDANNFQTLINRLEAEHLTDLLGYRKTLAKHNRAIVDLEKQLEPNAVALTYAKLALAKKELLAHERTKPNPQESPTDILTPEQEEAQARISAINTSLAELEARGLSLAQWEKRIEQRLHAVRAITGRVRQLKSAYQEFLSESAYDLRLLKLNSQNLVSLTTDLTALEKRDYRYQAILEKYKLEKQANTALETKFEREREENSNKLAAPQQRYQAYVEALRRWQDVHDKILGDASEPESIKGLEAAQEHIAALPELIQAKRLERLETTQAIFTTLMNQRVVRESLFEPLQSVITCNDLIRDEFGLQFVAKLEANIRQFTTQLFDLVKQISGELRGEEKAIEAVRVRFERHQFDTVEGALKFVDELHKLLEEAAKSDGATSYGIEAILRKDRLATEVYDLIFGLEFVEPKYTLRFQSTDIEQLSPGQRGALLLIFYLLVDKRRSPIVLDQPEENLDNQTIVSLLVPVIREAKKTRQVIMVTHNPNLAVVCDAEQVIYAEFSRSDGPKIKYVAGAIEEGKINKAVVDVLEGTMRAFDNRGTKYHK